MAKIRGTGQVRWLIGTSGDDDIVASPKGSLINSLAGTDTIKLGNSNDTVEFRQYTDTDILTGFDPAQDKIWVQSGHDLLPNGTNYHLEFSGALSDGLVFQNDTHTATFVVAATDYNGDGRIDTTIVMTDNFGAVQIDTLVFLGLAPGQLTDFNFFGG